MKKIRKISKPAAILLAFQMFMLAGLYQSLWATMISTESIINVDRDRAPRDYLNDLLARKGIQAVLISHGIDPHEAQDRIDNLTDQEIGRFVHELDQLPAGGEGTFLSFLLGTLICLILMATDIIIRMRDSKNINRDETTNESSNIKQFQPALKDQEINPADNPIIWFNPGGQSIQVRRSPPPDA